MSTPTLDTERTRDSAAGHALALAGVAKAFGAVRAVEDLSLRVPYGSIYGFLGPNGAGKTTTIRMIMSILYPDAGTITVLGDANPESVKHRLGYLPEEKGLYQKMKVLDMVAYLGRLRGMRRTEARERGLAMLQRFGLAARAEDRCETLSKGMSQKVQILSTLLHDPELIILDEPFSGLDPVNVELVRQLILELKREGRTVIFSTHVMEQAEQICDSILLINRGRKVLDGPLSEVKAAGDATVHLDYDGDGRVLWELPGVRRVNDAGKHAELVLAEGVDPQSILAKLVGQVRIRRFDTREPSLHEIFVRAVEGDVDE